MLQRGEDQMPAPGAQHRAVTVGHVQQPPHALQVFGRQHDGAGGGGRGRGLVRRGKGIPDGDDLLRSGITVAQQHGLFRGRGVVVVRRMTADVVISAVIVVAAAGAAGDFSVSAAHADFEAGFRRTAGRTLAGGGAGASLAQDG